MILARLDLEKAYCAFFDQFAVFVTACSQAT